MWYSERSACIVLHVSSKYILEDFIFYYANLNIAISVFKPVKLLQNSQKYFLKLKTTVNHKKALQLQLKDTDTIKKRLEEANLNLWVLACGLALIVNYRRVRLTFIRKNVDLVEAEWKIIIWINESTFYLFFATVIVFIESQIRDMHRTIL